MPTARTALATALAALTFLPACAGSTEASSTTAAAPPGDTTGNSLAAPDARDSLDAVPGDTGGVESTSLIDHTAWGPVTVDPFPDAPEPLDCTAKAFIVEQGTMEVDTTNCSYVALQQPSLVAVGAGESIHLVFWYLDLFATEAGDAHMGIAVGDTVVWEHTTSIPAQARVFDTVLTAPADLAAGAPVVLHIHNHGYNSYRLLALTRQRPM